MLPGPVFNVELVTTARRARYFALRVGYAALLLLFLWMNSPNPSYQYGYGQGGGGEVSIQQMAWIGRTLFATVVGTQTVALLFLTPALLAGVIADERQRKTLHYLLASRLSSGEIVLGKLAARLLHVAVFVLIGLPFLAMLTFFGGVDPNDVWRTFLATLSGVYFLSCLSVAVSVYSRRPREAVTLAYTLTLAWLFLPSLFEALLPTGGDVWAELAEWARPAVAAVGLSSPLYVVMPIRPGALGSGTFVVDPVLAMIGLQLAYGTALAALATARLRPLARREGARRKWTAWLRGRRGLRLFARPECGDRAMLWKECFVARSNTMARVVGGLMLAALVLYSLYGLWDIGKGAFVELLTYGYSQPSMSMRNDLNIGLRVIETLLAACLLVGVASSASGSLTGEREEDTWVSLIATPLTSDEIVVAKMVGSVWGMRPVFGVWLAFLVAGLALGAVHPLGAMAAVTVLVTNCAFGCALGTFFSARARSSSRALLGTIATLIVVNGAYLILLIPIRWESSLRLFGVSPFVQACSLMSYQDVGTMAGELGSPTWLRESAFDLLVTCTASVVVYGIAAGLIGLATLALFDSFQDRPSSRRNPRPKKPGGHAADPELPGLHLPATVTTPAEG